MAPPAPAARPLPQALAARLVPVLVEPALGECWVWVGRLNRNGYGRLRVLGRELMAHRLTYEALVGPIPSGLVLDHACRVRCCVNPGHLEPVTVQVNTLRGEAQLFGRDK
jgi:hypothetical protein